ncbi:nuclear speckle splicing regulatory protein 1 [Leptopilina boulardi]|uniref:nuclear speckle splicing regulatory protein 1 n=1 Tax=Leptopilina boulardi TaxID=63433 RepID=UPI0021F54E11|nr:nuclear speckle splicing regulatory protein 1 [Leptopilina boulardi]
MSGKPAKQFGLIMPKKNQLSAPKAVNVFGDDSDMDDDDGVDRIQKCWKAESGKSQIKKQALINAERALEEDPTIFQYDEIYSEIHVDTEKKKEEKKKQEPKYIKKLLQNAEKRKRENELRIERSVQKEREAEGDMFKDKEKFVTASYRKKLEENKKLEEDEKEEERLEAIGDVTKQVNIDGIYRHLYSQRFEITSKNIDKNQEQKSNVDIPKISIDQKKIKLEKNIDADDSSVNDSSSDEKTKAEALKIVSKSRKGKQYRKRGTEIMESESDEEKQEKKVEKEKEEIKESREKKIDNVKEKEQEKNEEEEKKKKKKEEEKSISNVEIGESSTSSVKRKERDENKEGRSDEELSNSPNKRKKDDVKPKPRKPERNVTIWIKRTVGPIFEAALQRYYARQAAKAS